MKINHMDSLNLDVSALGFGCMRFPTLPDGKIDRKTTRSMIDYAMSHGVTYYDTAYPYHNGESELVIGEILDDYPRSSYFLATKLPVYLVKKTEDVRRIFEEQLTKLNKDYVDFYLLHALNKERFDDMEALHVYEECLKLKNEGKIRHLGFSFHDSFKAFEEIITAHPWDFCQIQYNYMDTDEQAGDQGYALAEKMGIPMTIMEPVRGGSLARFSEDIESILKEVRPEKSMASWALRWVAGHPNCKVVLSGMSSPEQVRDNIDTFEHFEPLSDTEQDAIHQVVERLHARVQNLCTGCRYCMPCPNGVNIPGTFKFWNTYHMYQNYNVVKFGWESLPAEARPDQCVECGACEEQCPQKISIREDLKKASADLSHPIW